MIRKIVRLGGRLFTHPIITLRQMPALCESMRMRITKDSTFRRPQDLVHASNCPSRTIDVAVGLWKPATVLDVGCGTGKAMDHFRSHGLEVYGLEGSALAIESAQRPDLIRQCDLGQPVDLGRRFDLIYSVEVAEHIHANRADTFVDTLVRHADRVLMTAAHPGQGGLGHLNEQPPEYWAAKFAERGFHRVLDDEARLKAEKDLYCENLMVYLKD